MTIRTLRPLHPESGHLLGLAFQGSRTYINLGDLTSITRATPTAVVWTAPKMTFHRQTYIDIRTVKSWAEDLSRGEAIHREQSGKLRRLASFAEACRSIDVIFR